MRILFTTFPARGHFHPIAPLALAAQRAGHEVLFASGPDLIAWIRECGFHASAIGEGQGELLKAAAETVTGDVTLHLFTDIWVPAALPGLIDLARTWKPDFIVHEEEEYAAPLVASLLGIKCVTHSWHSPARPPADRDHAIELLAPLWSKAACDSPARTSGDLYLDACPPALQSDHVHDLGIVVWAVRPVSFDGPRRDPPAWLLDLPRPAAYITLGTVPVFSTTDGLRKMVRALAPLFASIVVTTGPNAVEAFGALGANIHVTQYLQQGLVLPNVDLVVSQAGAGGTLGAIEHALPHLMLPSFAQSQLSLSARISALGAGLALPEKSRTEANLQRAALTLLNDSRFKSEAQRIRAHLDALPAPDVVAARLPDYLQGSLA